MMMLNQKNNIEKNIILLKKRALYYLGKREYSRLELFNKINDYAKDLEIDNQNINIVLDHLESDDWLSDQRFTEQFIFSKKNKYGVEKIRYELKNRGVDEMIISKELIKIKSESDLLAKKIWSKKFSEAPKSPEEKAKQIRFLKGRGVGTELIHKIMSGKIFD